MAGYTVFHNVSVRIQANPLACWYTCYQMVVAYERGRGRGQGLTDPADNPRTQAWFAAGQTIPTWDEWESTAGSLGFYCDFSSMSSAGMLDLLGYSPVIYTGTWPGGTSTHSVVLVGLSENTLVYNDPLVGQTTKDYNEFMGQYLRQDYRSEALLYPY